MFHLETFKKCLSLIKHLILHACAYFKVQFTLFHNNIFLLRDFFFFYLF